MPINYADYNPDFHTISKRVRFEIADGRCQQCGQAHGEEVVKHTPDPAQIRLFGYEPVPVIRKVVLTTAHLDHDPRNDAETNLRALCAPCHLYYDRFDNANKRAHGKYYRLYQYEIDFSTCAVSSAPNQ